MNMSEIEKDPGWIYLKQSREAVAATLAKPFDSKKNCWIPDAEEGFLRAEIKSTKGDMVSVVTSKGTEVTLKKDKTQEMNPPKFSKAEDMANLTFLNEASVLGNLRDRYSAMMIYTYSGLFCVVINPYKRLPIYTESVISMFMGKRRNEMPPHLFAVADEAYRNMQMDRENQSLLITGESGAGKTENTKKVIAYFAIVGASQSKSDEVMPDGKKKPTLEDQIVQTNPVLEAFGNAKTVRNNNSSRFGKFIRTHFNRHGKLAGGDIEHYLLEKSRVVRQAPGERSYHIFYQMMSGQIKGLKEMVKLNNEMKYYHFQSQAELTIEGVDDAAEMRDTNEAFDIMGFSQDEKDNLFKLTAGIMHMGEMKFKQRGEQAEFIEEDVEDAKNAAHCFSIDFEKFLHALTKPRVRVGTEWVNKGQTLEQVNWAVNGLGKAIYARQFKWLIERCNKTLDAKAIPREYFIGVLDIAGFEIFDFNSFEQLWINFVNERLQQFFNHHMFVLEQEEYQREGIVWEFIDFGLDLQACIELIEKPMGIISMLDEECIVPKATDMTLVTKLENQHGGKHPNFQKPRPPKGKQAEAHFALVHYAGTVRYNCMQWLEKNKDPLNDTAVQALKQGKENALLMDIWKDYQTADEALEEQKAGGGGAKRKGKSSSFLTVSMIYRESLTKLMHMLHQTHPHFVRCIIPNEKKKSGMLDAGLVLNQLTCNGVLEGIRICRKGFPNRLMYPDFKHRYSILAAKEAKSDKDNKKCGEAIISKIVADGGLLEAEFKIGHTKVFFKAGVLAKLEDIRDEKINLIIARFQGFIRQYQEAIRARKMKESMKCYLCLQRSIRTWSVLRNWEWYGLWCKIRPQLKSGKFREEMARMEAEIKVLEQNIADEGKSKADLEALIAKKTEDKNTLFQQLQDAKNGLNIYDEQMAKLNSRKADLEKQLNSVSDKLANQEERNSDLKRATKKGESECDNYKKQIADLELALEKAGGDKGSKEGNISALQDELAQQDELVAKLNKEKKHQEEINRKLMEDLQAEEDKNNSLNKQKAKVEAAMDQLEDSVEREKRLRQDVDKNKRKLDGEIGIASDKIDELNNRKSDLENSLKKKEGEIHAMLQKLDDESSLVGKLQKQVKELQNGIIELEEEMEAERQSRSKSEKTKAELQRELEDLNERLDEAGGLTQAQIEVNKRREAELAKIRRDLDEANMNHENQLGAMRKKHNDGMAEMGETLDSLQKNKAKADKEKAQFQRDLVDLQSQLDHESRGKGDAEKNYKTLEMQVAEMSAKVDEQGNQLADFQYLKSRIQNENGDLGQQLEDSESQLNALHRLKSQLSSQLEEAKQTLDEESRERQGIAAQIKNFEHENESLKEQIDLEGESKADLQRGISKLNTEIQFWKTKFETEGIAKVDEIEDAKRKLVIRNKELQEILDAANMKCASLEKIKHQLSGEVDDAQVDVERANNYAKQMEQKQKSFDKLIDDWKRKLSDLNNELEAGQRDNRNLATDTFKLKNSMDELNETLEGLKRENRSLGLEIKDMHDQLADGGRSVHELQKVVRRFEMEKDELQQALDEAEAALEAEESKVLRAQVEVSQIRSDIEKRIQEKEEEFENTRKNHQRVMESMQATLESETKSKAEVLRLRKKLESDINDLEVALNQANLSNSDAQKNIRKYQDQLRELQMHLEEEQRQREDMREQYSNSERRCAGLQSEKEEITVAIDSCERARRQAEASAKENREAVSELTAENSSLVTMKRKAETELQALSSELDECLTELKSVHERNNKAMSDAARLAEELRQEQDHSMQIDRLRKGLEAQNKDMQARLDEAEAAALRGGKKVIQKLEARNRELEQEIDSENRRQQDAEKNLRKQDRRIKELEFQIEEDKKNSERLNELLDKLQNKIKTMKRQIEEAEEIGASNLTKYRQLQHQVQDSEDRAEMAENSVSKLRSKNRSSASMGPGALGPPAGLSTSASMGVFRSPSSRY